MLLKKIDSAASWLYTWMGRGSFFVAMTGVFIVHTLWLALSANLLPYDEYYHIGIIKYYSHQWSPFISHQTSEAMYFGDLTRLPSYMYHYLMSFPYRLLHTFTANETLVIILLRAANIGLMIGAVMLFRRLFRRAGISERLNNVASVLFLMMPFTVMLAAQINYDNLMFLLTPICLLAAYGLVTKPKAEVMDALTLVSAGAFASVVKHSFIVLFGSIVLYVLLSWRNKLTKVPAQLLASAKAANRWVITLLLVATVVSTGLFVERHVVNVIRYRQINVACTKVQPFEVCNEYSPWRRNNTVKNNPPAKQPFDGIGGFTVHWTATIMAGIYPIYANIQHEIGSRDDPYGDYVFKPRLAILLAVAYGVLAAGVVAVVWQLKAIIKQPLLRMTGFITLVLLLALYLFNFRAYLSVGKPYAIQFRYLLPMVLPVMVTIGWAASRSVQSRYIKQYVVIAIVGINVLFGGVVGWILRADPNWYWPNNAVILHANQSLQALLIHIVPH